MDQQILLVIVMMILSTDLSAAAVPDITHRTVTI